MLNTDAESSLKELYSIQHSSFSIQHLLSYDRSTSPGTMMKESDSDASTATGKLAGRFDVHSHLLRAWMTDAKRSRNRSSAPAGWWRRVHAQFLHAAHLA